VSAEPSEASVRTEDRDSRHRPLIDRPPRIDQNSYIADEPDTELLVTRKSLVDRSPSRRFTEDFVLPWPEAGLPPFGAMTCCIAPGGRCDPDRHNQDEMAFIYRGFGEIIVGQDVSPVRQGDVVFIPRNAEHIFSNTSSEGDLAFFSVWWPRIEPQG
jgi:quercetin dioxygenase-like cupin family protein